MPIARLSLTDFRSYADLVVEPGPGLVILSGENGAGKTNILEAVSLLSPGRGLRGAALREMARTQGAGGFAVAARLGTGAEAVDIGTGTAAASPDRRLVRINAAPAAANMLGDWLSVLWLTPAMDRLFTEGAGGRRRFLDRLVLALHPGHAVHAARYEAAMRARTKLLTGEAAPDPLWLDALEARMADHGAAIAAARDGTLAELATALADAPPGPFARAQVALEGGGAEGLAEALAQGRARDSAAGRALVGPHRADLRVIHEEKQVDASLCSTGEQKALLLSIILAHATLVRARSRRPLILLLDEVAAHLDPRRRGALFDRLADGMGQVWMTGTEPALFAGASGVHFPVAGGRIQGLDG